MELITDMPGKAKGAKSGGNENAIADCDKVHGVANCLILQSTTEMLDNEQNESLSST